MAEGKAGSPDLQQIRNILFGEQASQIEDRFTTLEQNINALRRETRQLRQALEVEATARTEADHALDDSQTAQRQAALNDLLSLWQTALAGERADREAHGQKLATALEAYRQAQDAVTAQLIAHLQREQQQRAEQFMALLATLTANATGQSEATMSLSAALDEWRGRHISAAEAA